MKEKAKRWVSAFVALLLAALVLWQVPTVTAEEDNDPNATGEPVFHFVNTTATLHADGSATIEEIIDVTVNAGAELHRTLDLVEGQTITDFAVWHALNQDQKTFFSGGTPLSEVDEWDASGDFDALAGKYARVGNELHWGITEYGSGYYRLVYTISSFVQQSATDQFIRWPFVLDHLDLPPKQGLIPNTIAATVKSDGPALSNADGYQVWGLGFSGVTEFTQDGTIEVGVQPPHQMVDVAGGEIPPVPNSGVLLIQIPDGTYETTQTIDASFDDYAEELFADPKLKRDNLPDAGLPPSGTVADVRHFPEPAVDEGTAQAGIDETEKYVKTVMPDGPVDQTTIHSINVLVTLHEDGSASVQEDWLATVKDDGSFRRKLRLLRSQQFIFDHIERDEIPLRHVADPEFYGESEYDQLDNGLRWDVGSRDQIHNYRLTYDIAPLVVQTANDQMIFLDFVAPEDDLPPQYFSIRIRSDFGYLTSEEGYRVWGFGFNGEAKFEDGVIVATTDEMPAADGRGTLLIRIPNGTFTTQAQVEQPFDDYLAEALTGSAYEDKNHPTEAASLMGGELPPEFSDVSAGQISGVQALLLLLAVVPVLWGLGHFIQHRL